MFDPKKTEHVSMKDAQEREKQNPITKAASVASIVFVSMAESGQLDDVTAVEHADQFSSWAYPVDFKAGNIREFNGNLYRCARDHTSQADWTPDVTPALWVKIGSPKDEWPEWSQPRGAHDAYNAGDQTAHKGEYWTSDLDGNVWEPGVYGWTKRQRKEGGQ